MASGFRVPCPERSIPSTSSCFHMGQRQPGRGVPGSPQHLWPSVQMQTAGAPLPAVTLSGRTPSGLCHHSWSLPATVRVSKKLGPGAGARTQTAVPAPDIFFFTEIPPPQALGGGWSPRQPDPSLALRASPEGSGGGFPSQAKLDIVTGASGLAAQRAEVPGEGRGALTLCSL